MILKMLNRKSHPHLGFKTFSVEQKDVFTHIMALKTKERIEEEAVVRFKI